MIGDETVINLQRAKVYVFSDSVLCLGKIHQHPESNEASKKRIEGITTDKSYRDHDGINGEPTEFEWNIFPGFTTLQLCGKVNDLLSDLGEAPETFTGRFLFMSMFNDISCVKKDNEEECVADQKTIETIFRIIVFANQLSLYGAVANMCEEFESLYDRSGQPDVLMGQSTVFSEIKTEVPLQNENPSHQNLLLQQYEERIKLLSQENKVSKFCMDAGVVNVVEVGQYFMTKDTGDFRQFRAVACREYTLPRDDGSSQPRGWIQGNTRIGPVLEVTTIYLYGKHGIEIRIGSLSEDNSHSWVRISHGS